jgi:hypothetical protein
LDAPTGRGGGLANRRLTNVAAITITAVIVGMNLYRLATA